MICSRGRSLTISPRLRAVALLRELRPAERGSAKAQAEGATRAAAVAKAAHGQANVLAS